MVHRSAQQLNKNLQKDYNNFVNYLTSLVQTLIEPKIMSAHFRIQSSFQKLQNVHEGINSVDNQKIQPYFLYNHTDNILAYQNLSFENISHCHYYLKHVRNNNRSQFQDRSWVEYLSKQNIRLFIKYPKPNMTKKEFMKNEKQKVNLIQIPVRGRYCKHIDFFDLYEVYSQIFPRPYCQPQQTCCPECLVEIPFQELIFLKQIQVILQMIKMFILQNQDYDKFMCKNKNKTKPIAQSSKSQSALSSQEQINHVLKDLRMIVDHQKQTVRLKGKYLTTCQQQGTAKFQQFSDGKSSKPKLIEFQADLDRQVYETMINPNKNFRSTRKLVKFMSNLGKSHKNLHTSLFARRFSQFQDNEMGVSGQCVNFSEQIQTARSRIVNRQHIYKDLEKGTIAI